MEQTDVVGRRWTPQPGAPSVVELAGLPGSGKSTVVEMLAASGVEAKPLPLIRPLAAAVRHPVTVVRSAAQATAAGCGRGLNSGRHALQRHVAQLELSRRSGARTVVIDEGVVHQVWSSLMTFPAMPSSLWTRLLRVDGPLVVLDVPVGELARRIGLKTMRGPINAALADLPAEHPEWGRVAALYEQVIEASLPFRPVHRIDASGSAAATAEAVHRLLGGITVR